MPKDATKNIDRYKIRGGQLNEFDFTKNQEQFAEQGTRKATKAELIGNAGGGAGTKAGKAAKGAGNKGSKAAKGAGAKKRGKK